MAKNLLHSMSHFQEIFNILLDRCNPRVIVEVGSEYAGSTRALAAYAMSHDAMLYVIDPSPKIDTDAALADFQGNYRFIREKSVDALQKLSGDIFIIDGDHNYWTVLSELKAIWAKNPEAWIVLHDVGYPWARRDLYYDPEQIPPESRHPYSYEYGVDLKTDELLYRAGFWGRGDYAIALVSGTQKNGVLTAVEDFIADKTQLCYRSMPLIFGMGVIVPAQHANFIAHVFDPYRGPLCEALERNRLDLYNDFLQLSHEKRKNLVRRLVNRIMCALGL